MRINVFLQQDTMVSPPGCEDHLLPNLRPDKYPFMVHGEINAIASSRQDLRNASLYSTHSPCRDCSKAIITAGIKRVIFRNAYKNDDHEFVEKFFNFLWNSCRT